MLRPFGIEEAGRVDGALFQFGVDPLARRFHQLSLYPKLGSESVSQLLQHPALQPPRIVSQDKGSRVSRDIAKTKCRRLGRR